MAHSCAHDHKSSVHNHSHHAHSHRCSHDHSHPHSHSHHSVPEKVSRAIASPPSHKPKKEKIPITPLRSAALAAAAGAATFLFIHMYNRGSASYRSYQVPLDGSSTNPVTSQALTFQTSSVATAILVESLFFMGQALNMVRFADFTSLAEYSPAVAARYIKDWPGAVSHLASSLVCAKNNGETKEQQDKIGLYAAHKIAPEHDKEDLIRSALACRNLSPMDQKEFRKNAKEYLENLDKYREVANMLHNNDPIRARVIASSMPIAQGLQKAAHRKIHEMYFIFTHRKDAFALFSKSLDAALKNPKYIQDGKLALDISTLLVEELIRFREAVFTNTSATQKMGFDNFWNEQLEKILEASSFPPEQAIKWYSLLSSHGSHFTPWLGALLKKTSLTQDILPKLQPASSLSIGLQQEHKILSLKSYVDQKGVTQENFDFLLRQVDECINIDLSLHQLEKIQDLMQKLVSAYKKTGPFLQTTLYVPSRDISKKCLELVAAGFSRAGMDVADVLLPFPASSITSWAFMSIEKEINIQLYKEQMSADTATKLLSKVAEHKKGEQWELRIPYIKSILAAAQNPTQAQLQTWLTTLLSIESHQASDTTFIQNIFTKLLDKIPSLTDETLQKLLDSKWQDFFVDHLAKKELGLDLYAAQISFEQTVDHLKTFIAKINSINPLTSLYLQKIVSGVPKDKALIVALEVLSHYKKTDAIQKSTEKALDALLKKMQGMSGSDLQQLLDLQTFEELILKTYINKEPLTLQRFHVVMHLLNNISSLLPKIPVIDELVKAYTKQHSGRFLIHPYIIQGYNPKNLDLLEEALRANARAPEEKQLKLLRKNLEPAQQPGTIR